MNILTFDIEDWYNHDDYSRDLNWGKHEVRIYTGVEKILSTLERTGCKGTFFCLGWIAEHHPQIIRMIAESGHHIGCHSYQHELATRFTIDEFEEDTYKAKALIEDACGHEVDAYRVPSFSVTRQNLWMFEILARLGFRYDCSVFPSAHEFGGFPRFPVAEPFAIETKHGLLKEFPLNVTRFFGRELVFSGGGYFRVIPYPLIDRLTRKSEYVMSYFHPSDFDPGQPRMPQLSAMRQYKNRVCLKGAYEKFEKYIEQFNFLDLRQADRLIDWSSRPILTPDYFEHY